MSTDHNFWRERRAEVESNRGPSAYQPNALPLDQSGSRLFPMHALRGGGWVLVAGVSEWHDVRVTWWQPVVGLISSLSRLKPLPWHLHVAFIAQSVISCLTCLWSFFVWVSECVCVCARACVRVCMFYLFLIFGTIIKRAKQAKGQEETTLLVGNKTMSTFFCIIQALSWKQRQRRPMNK